jgi:hypothetical protein
MQKKKLHSFITQKKISISFTMQVCYNKDTLKTELFFYLRGIIYVTFVKNLKAEDHKINVHAKYLSSEVCCFQDVLIKTLM